jgi:pimeloyl-ACP methyl ester carboxylesterase
MKPETLATLSQRYDGRVFAFDHWTLSHDPKDNVKWFMDQIPAGLSLDVDIVCHSRGGLVSRVLASGLPDAGVASDRLRVGRIVFVATPNDGTLLTHPDHMVKMLDRYTNIVQFLPDGPLEVFLEAVVTAVKVLAHGGLRHLPGLAAQRPGGDFLGWLRGGPQGRTRYYAIAADWEPAEDSPLAELVKQKVADTVMDQVFKDAKNDLVVPTLGVAGASGPGFPIADAYTFAASAGAIHTNLFKFDETQQRLLEWLEARSPLVV